MERQYTILGLAIYAAVSFSGVDCEPRPPITATIDGHHLDLTVIDQPVAPVSAPAVRLTPPSTSQVVYTPVPGIHGLALAPADLDGCARAEYYRIQFGLPKRFVYLVWRETRCMNTLISRTGCCTGALQIAKVVFRDHRMQPGLTACGNPDWYSINGPDDPSWQRQYCVAQALYAVDGLAPWGG